MKLNPFIIALVFTTISWTALARQTVLIIEAVDKDVATVNDQSVDSAVFDDHGIIIKSIIDRTKNFNGVVVEGNAEKPIFWDYINTKIEKENIRFVNVSLAMSLGKAHFPPLWATMPKGMEHPEVIHDRVYKSLHTLIASHPDTLFIIGAGNGVPELSPIGVSIEREEGYFSIAPANFKYSNMLTIGSINTNDIVLDQLNSYLLSDFSNMGLISVDLLCPGENINGDPKIWGTSVAAPYTFLAIDPILENLPQIQNTQVQEILMKSVYNAGIEIALNIPFDKQASIVNGAKEPRDVFFAENPNYLPVKSGGIVFPQRVSAVVKIMAKSPSLSVTESVKQTLKNEGMSDSSLINLELFWTQRGI